MSGKYRILHTSFWNEDPDMYDLTPEQKYFYIYILTGPQTKQCGISVFSTKIASDQTGYNQDTINKLIKMFQEDLGKILYNPKTRELAIRNWARWNYYGKNSKVKVCIEKELKLVKDRTLIDYVWKNREEDIEIPGDNGKKDEAKELAKRLIKEKIEMIFNHWKIVMKHPGASLSDERAAKIRTRLKEGFTYDQCIAAIDGCAGSSFHMGKNDDGTVYDSIDLIFRNTSNTEGFISRNKSKVAVSIKKKAEDDNYDWEHNDEEE